MLGSNGSVVPLFTEQIADGGPVTVTHPDVLRYFMTIPEACQLILQASAIGSHEAVYTLDMGEPVRIAVGDVVSEVPVGLAHEGTADGREPGRGGFSAPRFGGPEHARAEQ